MEYDEVSGVYFSVVAHLNTTLGAIVRVEAETAVALEVQVSATEVNPWRTHRSSIKKNHALVVFL